MTQNTSGTPSKRAHAYIFDLDGTLVDSLEDITCALNAARTELGMQNIACEQVRDWVGDGIRSLCRRSAPEANETMLKQLVEGAAKHYAEHPIVHTRLYPNILKLLNLLREGGSRLAVLSNKPHALTVEIVARLNLADFFTSIEGSRLEEERKPDPRVARRIALHLGTPHDAIYLVGDSVADVETARNAGLKSVAVTWGFQDRRFLEASKPDFLVSEPLEIPALP